MIRKRKDGYYLISGAGKNLGGPYKTIEGARRREKQVKMFKHMKNKRRS